MKTIVRLLALVVVIALLFGTTDAQLRYGKLGIGVAGSAYLPMIDEGVATATKAGITDPTLGMGGGLSFIYSPWEYIAVKGIVGIGQFSYKYRANTASSGLPSTTTMAALNGYATINFMPNSSFNPWLGGGVGYHYTDARTDQGAALVGAGPTRAGIALLGTAGFDLFLGEFFSVTASADYAMMGSDWIEGVKASGNDNYLRAGLELRYYFFDQAFLTRLLEALKKRYEGG